LQAAQKDLRGEAREKSTSGGVLNEYVVARRLSATKYMSLFQQPAREENNKVSIIIVNWNGEKLLKNCLDALSSQSYANYEIILVDNGSADNSVRFARENFPAVKIVALKENKGFTGGNAAGLEVAQGAYIALVNNDARAEKKWLQNLIQPMLLDRTVGICSSKLIFENTQTVNSAGDGLTTAGVGFNRGLGGNAVDFNAPEPVFGACGAAALYRRHMLDEIGFLDEDFFLYDEDTDLNFRAQLAGWKCIYVPTAVAYHVANATSKRLSDLHVYYHTRNLEFVWMKNMPCGLMIRFAHHKVIQELGSFCYLCLRHGKWGPFFRAKRDALRMLPLMLEKRKQIQTRRRVPNRYVRSTLRSMFTMGFFKQKVKQLIEG
jgi:GT2 family glycosyltransferase